MKITSMRILVGGAFFVACAWGSYAFLKLDRGITQWGQFGDKFGALNTLFTGLAFVAVVATLWHERESAADREAEHQAILNATGQHTAAATKQAAATAHLAFIRAITARIDGYNVQLAPLNPAHPDWQKLRDERKSLYLELDKAIQNPLKP